ncbi:UvrD-helicase domain-containing protein [Candidatus Nomurabacteria bacterium]|nr:UvrD-helicase domain-containing protein [Candidatus Nomurabacteria bacterium]
MNTEYLKDLNAMQQEAVLYTDGPLLIVAGAGAGKTKTLTYRILHLIRSGVNPNEILAVTFTNKAAKEMRDRVTSLLSDRKYDSSPFVSTFHSLGVNIIRENAHLLGLTRHFTIADDSDTTGYIKEALKELDLDPKQFEPRKIKSIISRSKGDFISREQFIENIRGGFQEVVAKVWEKYDMSLKKEGALDFDDLLLKSVQVLKENLEIRHQYHKRYKYVMIDEYQDTNEVQYELVKLLVGENKNICVVGDTDQNIYSWRGANIKNMLHFEKDYPDTKIVMLEQNYRSTKTILEAANEVIKKNVYRVPKNLFTEKEVGEMITLHESFDEGGEAAFVADTVYSLLESGKVLPTEIAVLYRANFQSRILEEAFLGRQIPYQVLGVKFFERKEIKDVLAYLRASLNRDSLSDIKRIINVPARGIGKVTIAKIFANQFGDLPSGMQVKVNMFYGLLHSIREYMEDHSTSETIKFVINKSGIEEELKQGSAEEQEKLENIKELVTLSLKYDAFGAEGIDMLLSDAALASDQDSLMHNNGGVRLMTVHASKGLEFKYVFITGLEQDLFPHSRSNSRDAGESEEERRLFYVAVTRAEHKLYLCYAVLRTIFGMKQVNTPSEFLNDIPAHLTHFEQGGASSDDKIVYL